MQIVRCQPAGTCKTRSAKFGLMISGTKFVPFYNVLQASRVVQLVEEKMWASGASINHDINIIMVKNFLFVDSHVYRQAFWLLIDLQHGSMVDHDHIIYFQWGVLKLLIFFLIYYTFLIKLANLPDLWHDFQTFNSYMDAFSGF